MAVERVEMSDNPLKADFPALAQTMNGKVLAYLDSASSAQKPNVVIEAMRSIYEDGYANIHRGLYRISQDLTTEFEAVRSKVAAFIHADGPETIVFTRNTTEAINLVAASWGRTHLKAGDEIILTEMEHHANIVPWQLLAQEKGVVIKTIPVLGDGTLDLSSLYALLTEKTRLVACVHISNALGTVNPVAEIIQRAKTYNPDIVALVDGTQSVVHQKVDVQAMGCDFFAFTGHKLYGPNGIGVLYGRKAILDSMPPYQGGGDMIESVSLDNGTTFKAPPHRFEAGTPAIVEVIGLGAALDYMAVTGFDAIGQQEEKLKGILDKTLADIEDVIIYGPAPDHKIGITSFALKGIHSSDVSMILDQCGVAVRSGHHCCMPLMNAMGVEGTIRASIGLYTDENDIIQLRDAILKAKDLLA